MKIATDLEQSKKLAKILPLKSADMFYLAAKGEPIVIGNKMIAVGSDDWDALGEPDVPAWSLSALLKIIGRYAIGPINNNKYILIPTLHPSVFSNSCDDLVDACVEVIIKLYEKKLL